MHDLDAKKTSGAAQPDHLLDELTSIKDLLAGEQVAGKQVAGERMGGEQAVGQQRTNAQLMKEQLADTQPTGAIPLLDDLVALPAQSPLLDIERIFNDDVAAPLSPCIEAPPTANFQFPKFTLDVAISDEPVNSHSAATATDNTMLNLRASHLHQTYRREALIQELIAEFAPQIEAALRERLERLDNAALQALKTQS